MECCREFKFAKEKTEMTISKTAHETQAGPTSFVAGVIRLASCSRRARTSLVYFSSQNEPSRVERALRIRRKDRGERVENDDIRV